MICIHCYGHSPIIVLLFEPFLSIMDIDIFVLLFRAQTALT
jgi:hypothetical protein